MQRAISITLLCEGPSLLDEDTILKTLQRVIDESNLDAKITIARNPTDPPELDHDRMMLQKYQHKLSAHGKSERRVVWNLFAHLAAAGWTPVSLNDGEEITPATDAKSVMELLFNLDDAYVTVTNGKREHWLRFVLGNAPDEVLSDYSYSNGFDAVIEAFKPENFV